MGVGVVVEQFKVFEGEAEDVADVWVEFHRRQGSRVAGELFACLVDVVEVEVCVAERVDELAGGEAGGLGGHHGQQGVTCDVEGDAEEDVGRALVELAGEFAFGDVELEEAVAGRQLHLVDLPDVPGADEHPARVGRVSDLVDDLRDLIDVSAVGGGPVAPLVAVNGAEFAVGIRPFVPDTDAVVLEVADVGVALEEPEQLVDDRPQVQLLGGEQWEAAPAPGGLAFGGVVEVEAHLVAEDGLGAGACPVVLECAVVHHVLEQVEVLAHGGEYSGEGSGGRVRGTGFRAYRGTWLSRLSDLFDGLDFSLGKWSCCAHGGGH